MHLLEWSRRHRGAARPGSAIADLLADGTPSQVAAERGLPRAAALGIESFYDQIGPGTRVCTGTACEFAGSSALRERLAPLGPVRDVHCLGYCHDAPACRIGDRVFARANDAELAQHLAGRATSHSPMQVRRQSLVDRPIVLRHLLGQPPHTEGEDYDLPDGAAILAALEASALRGRGGAAYPTAAKWRAARDTPSPVRYVVANGDEGDPGSFVDRLLLEEDPHAVLAGMVACARVIGAQHGVVFVRAEYPRAQLVVQEAIARARARGVLGTGFDVEMVSGAGSYVCGEETALLRAIEGLRGEPSPKPPYPAQVGLFGRPTVVQNVETLAVVPWVVRSHRASGTKAVSLSGAIARPGVVEVPLGMSLRRIFEDGGGGAPAGRRWHMALIGGPMGRVLPESAFDTPLSYESLPGMGHAGVVVLDDSVTAGALARHLFAFARAESCGSCTPCRAGSAQLGMIKSRRALERLLDTMAIGSLCGFGQGIPRPLRDLLAISGEQALSC